MLRISVGDRRFPMSALVSKAARIAGKGERLTRCGRPIGGKIQQVFNIDPERMLNAIKSFNANHTMSDPVSKVLELLADPQTLADTVRMGVAIYKEQGLKPSDIIKHFMPLKESIPEENQIDYIACLVKEATADLSIAEKGQSVRKATAKLSPAKKGKVIRNVTAKFSLPDMVIVIQSVISGMPAAEKGTVLRKATAKLALPDKIIVINSVTANVAHEEYYIVKTRATAGISHDDMMLFEGPPSSHKSQRRITHKYFAALPPDKRGPYARALTAKINSNYGKAQVIKDAIADLPLSKGGFLVKPIVVRDAIAWLSPANRGGVLKNLTDSPSTPDDELIMYIREAAADLDRDGKAILIREATLKRRPGVKGKAIREVVSFLDCRYVLSIVTANLCLDDKAIAIKAATDKLSCILVKRKVISAPELKAIIIRGALANLSSADREAVLQKVTDGLSQEEKAAIDKEMAEEKILDELFQPSN